MKCFINDDLLEIINLHELCSSVSIAMLQMKTFLLGFLKKGQTFFSSILTVFCIASLAGGMLGQVIRGGHQNYFQKFIRCKLLI